MVMLLIDAAYGVINSLIKKSLDQGLNELVLVTLRQLIATAFLAPIAYFRERYALPSLRQSIWFLLLWFDLKKNTQKDKTEAHRKNLLLHISKCFARRFSAPVSILSRNAVYKCNICLCIPQHDAGVHFHNCDLLPDGNRRSEEHHRKIQDFSYLGVSHRNDSAHVL